MAADMEIIESIRRVEQDIREALGRQKEANAEYVDAISALPEYKAVQAATDILKNARMDLSSTIARDEEISRLRADIEERSSQLSDLREILSYNLVRYHETSNHQYIEEVDSKKVRPIVLTAKLGKPEFQQESLPFAQIERDSDASVEITATDAAGNTKVIKEGKK